MDFFCERPDVSHTIPRNIMAARSTPQGTASVAIGLVWLPPCDLKSSPQIIPIVTSVTKKWINQSIRRIFRLLIEWIAIDLVDFLDSSNVLVYIHVEV